MQDASTFAKENYSYDNASRLTQVQDTPLTGSGANICTTRQYGYDADSDIVGLTTIHATGATCDTTAADGTTQTHGYDQADRLTDTGTSFDPMGDMTALAAGDDGGQALQASYWTTGMIHTTQVGSSTITFNIDPEERIRERVTSQADLIDHFADSSDIGVSARYSSVAVGMDREWECLD